MPKIYKCNRQNNGSDVDSCIARSVCVRHIITGGTASGTTYVATTNFVWSLSNNNTIFILFLQSSQSILKRRKYVVAS